MRLRRIVVAAIVGVVLLGGLTAVQDTVFRERIEDKLTDSATAELSEAGLDDVDVSFTGRDGEVTAKTEAAAVEAGALVEGVSGVRVVQAFGPDGEVSGRAESEAGSEDSGDATEADAEESEPSASAAPEESAAPTAEEREEARAELDGFRSIGFEHNSDVLTADGLEAIDAVAAVLKEHAEVTVRIEGHADITGNLAHTQDLSDRRAQRVLARLVELGIEADRLSAKGYGETQPLVAGRPDVRNRRVEFAITN